MSRYYLYMDSEIKGPWSADDLSQAGPFTLGTLVCEEDVGGRQPENWRGIEEVAELAPYVRRAGQAQSYMAASAVSGGHSIPEMWETESDPGIEDQLWLERLMSFPMDEELLEADLDASLLGGLGEMDWSSGELAGLEIPLTLPEPEIEAALPATELARETALPADFESVITRELPKPEAQRPKFPEARPAETHEAASPADSGRVPMEFESEIAPELPRREEPPAEFLGERPSLPSEEIPREKGKFGAPKQFRAAGPDDAKKAKFGRPKSLQAASIEESQTQSLPPAPPQPPPVWAMGGAEEVAQAEPARTEPAPPPPVVKSFGGLPAAEQESPIPAPEAPKSPVAESQGPIFAFPQAQAPSAAPAFAGIANVGGPAAGTSGNSPFPFAAQAPASQVAEPKTEFPGIVIAAAPVQTDEVIARLARPGPQTQAWVAAPKRSKTFIWIAAGCLVVLSSAIFVFFRNPSSLPKIMNAGAPPVATEPQQASPFPAAPAETATTAQAPAQPSPAEQAPVAQPPAAENAQQAAPQNGPVAVEGQAPVSQSPAPQSPQPQASETAGATLNSAPASTEQTPAAEQPSAGANPAATAAAPAAATDQSAAQSAPQNQAQAAGNDAIDLVKNYPLDGDRKSVGAWLQYSFMADPNENNKEEWTPGALDATTYAVQYRVVPGPNSHLTQPISYVFEADLSNGTVMGKNPAAKDLLSGVSTEEEATPSRRKVSIKPKEDDSEGSGDSSQAPQSSNSDSTQQSGGAQ